MKTQTKLVKLKFPGNCSNYVHAYLTEHLRFDNPEINMKHHYRVDWKRGVIEFHIDDSYRIKKCFDYLRLKTRRI